MADRREPRGFGRSFLLPRKRAPSGPSLRIGRRRSAAGKPSRKSSGMSPAKSRSWQSRAAGVSPGRCSRNSTTSLGLLRLLVARLHLAVARRPAVARGLRAALDRQRVVRHILGDHRSRTDIGAAADLHRRHQRRIRADEGAGADRGLVLVEAVVVAGDGAGADVGTGADMGVADVGEMIDLDAGFENRGLGLDEIADPRALAQRRSRPQPRVGTDRGILADRWPARCGRMRGSQRHRRWSRRGRSPRTARWSRRCRMWCRRRGRRSPARSWSRRHRAPPDEAAPASPASASASWALVLMPRTSSSLVSITVAC